MRKGQRDMHKLQEFVRLHREGVGATQVARRMGWDRKTERSYRKKLDEAGLLRGDPDDLPTMAVLREALPLNRNRPAQERSSVEKHAAFIVAKIAMGLGPTAIHELLIEEVTGYEGSLSAVKRFVAATKKRRGAAADDVAIPVHTAPGQQAQVDFGYVGKLLDEQTGKRRKAWVFVMTLSHSRLIYAEVVFSQDIETWLQAHRRAFKAFGGVPKVVVPDNLKSAVIKAAFAADEMGEINRTYRDFARYHGFMIDPTPAYAPKKKGKVESSVKYVKGSFFKPRADQLVELNATNRRLWRWLEETANCRKHGTTGRRPIEHYEEAERAELVGLPDTPYVPVLWRRVTVAKTSHLTWKGRFYSVPFRHLDQKVWVRICGEQLTVYADDERVADHRTSGPTPWSTKPEHLPEGRRDLAQRDPATWYARAASIAPEVEDYARAVMASDEVHYPLRRVISIVRQLERLPTERATSVVAHAARYGCYRPDGIRRIIDRGHDLHPVNSAPVSPEWASSGRFARQVTEFLVRHGGDHASA